MMKKVMAMLMALTLLGSVALSESSIQEKEQDEATQDSTGIFSWVSDAWNTVTTSIEDGLNIAADSIASGWNTVTESVVSGVTTVTTTLSDWKASVDLYMTERQWDEDVRSAWNTLKEGAESTGSVALEELSVAYQTVCAWLIQADDTMNQGITAAVDAVASAAGVTGAQIASWYGTVERYVTENGPVVTDAVMQGWNTIKQGAMDVASVSYEKIEEAYHTVLEWLNQSDAEGKEETTEALEGIMTHLRALHQASGE